MNDTDDANENVDTNVLNYPFEENGYEYKSIPGIYYGPFLSYKIERQVLDNFREDTHFSLNSISTNVFDVNDFKILIEKEKFDYLLNYKSGRLKKCGLIDISCEELEEIIKNKINDNYIYNMEYLEEYDTIKFNILLEILGKDTSEIIKFIVALEYDYKEKILRLITMY